MRTINPSLLRCENPSDPEPRPLTDCDLYAETSDAPIESDDAETRIPIAEGQEPVAIGRLLDGAALTLLDLRQSGWSEGEGSEGEADICWHCLPGEGRFSPRWEDRVKAVDAQNPSHARRKRL